MDPRQGFKVSVSGYHSSADEARQVRNVPVSDLPLLSDEELEAARKLSVPTESYQRMKLAGAHGRQRMEEKGKALGALIQRVLERLESGYSLEEVVWQGARLRWLVRVYAPPLSRTVGVPVPYELVDDAVDAEVLSAISRLDDLVLAGVGRDEMIMKHD